MYYAAPTAPSPSGEGRGGAVPRAHASAAKPHPNPPLKGRGEYGAGRFHKNHHPGEGRGPGGKASVMKGSPSLAMLPNWAPAFAGVAAITAPDCALPHHR